MNYYHEKYDYYQNGQNDVVNGFAPMLGNIEEPRENDVDYDPEADEKFNKLLEEIEQNDLITDLDKIEDKKDVKIQDPNDDFSGARHQYEDYYDDFTHAEVEQVPDWYEFMIEKKIKETKRRLEELSSLVCYASASTKKQITRIERDHNTPFCKLDYPKHPSLKKAWNNYWRFNCATKCKVDPPEPQHAHTQDCEILVLEHVPTGTTIKSQNILPNEFPAYVMHTVELFQEFASLTSKDPSLFLNDEIPDTTYERPHWSYIKIRSNYKEELMLIACGKGVTPLIKPLKRYFFGHNGRGRCSNVVSLYCINVKWSQKKSQFPPTYITGCLELRDKIGPISINYNAKTNINFNSAEAEQLGRIMYEYLSLTVETTAIDIGCNFGILSLMLAQKCDRVLGLNILEHEIKLAEEVKRYNNIHNVSFIVATPKEVQTKCSSLIKKCITVATLNLSTSFGKSADVMKALRNLPSVWRVVVYGAFTREFHKHITVLTSKDDQMGDEFLPMQGCILDKSASIPNAFDIVILFERKSLIEPSIELITSGPTVNIKADSSWGIKTEVPENQIHVKSEKDVEKNADAFVKNPIHKPFIPKHLRVTRKFGKFDSPLLPKERKDLKPEISHKPVVSPPLPTHRSSNAKVKHLKKIFDCQSIVVPKNGKIQSDSPEPIQKSNALQSKPIKVKSEYVPITANIFKDNVSEYVPITANNYHGQSTQSKPIEKKPDYVPITANMKISKKQFDNPKISKPPTNQIKQLKKQYDCPPLPSAVKQEKQNQNPPLVSQIYPPPENLNNPQPVNLNYPIPVSLNCPPLVNLNFPPAVSQISPIYYQSTVQQENQFSSQSFFQKENEFHYLPTIKPEVINPPLPPQDYPPPPPEGYIPDPPPDDCPPFPKEELQQPAVCPALVTPKVEPSIEFDKEREEGELSDSEETNNSAAEVTIKCEPMDLDDELEPSNIVSNTFIKCEPVSTESYVDNDYTTIRIKSEPVDDEDQQQQEQLLTSTSVIAECANVIKQEPVEGESSPNLDDIENMPTPIHKSASLRSSASPPVSANFTIDGFQFSVKPNQSFLAAIKPDPEQISLTNQQSTEVSVKQERSVDVEQQPEQQTMQMEPISSSSQENDEISIIGEKRDPKEILSQSRIKKEKFEGEHEHTSSELCDLLEVRANLKKKLKEERSDPLEVSDSPTDTFNQHRRSMTKSLRYREPVESDRRASSPCSPDNRHFRRLAYSPDTRRLRRSPSPIGGKRFRRSPSLSPSDRSYRRSSPFSSIDRRYRNTSPISPTERRFRHVSPSYSRSPSSTSYVKRKYYRPDHSPSPSYSNRKYYRTTRSPSTVSNRRYGGRSPSPVHRKYARSPSPESRKYPRSPSTLPRKYVRSPSPEPRKYPRSPSPLPRKYIRAPSSEPRKYLHSSTPVSKKYVRSSLPNAEKVHVRSMSPVIDCKSKRPASPTAQLGKKVKRKKRSKSPSENRKSKKERKKERSRSKSAASEETNHLNKQVPLPTNKDNDENGDWDIPALSALSDESPTIKKEIAELPSPTKSDLLTENATVDQEAS